MKKLMALCSRSEKCEHDAREYMLMHGASEEDADLAVEYLVANSFVDNERYALAFVADKFRFAKWGERKIEAALRLKKIPDSLIASAMQQAIEPEDEKMAIETEMAKKLRGIKNTSRRETWQKLMRFGLSRGYPSDICNDIIGRLLADSQQ